MFLLQLLFVVNIAAIGLTSANPLSRIDKPNARVVGGNVTTIEENPWQVSLQHDRQHECGGVIINEKWILTSANCEG